MTSSDFSQLVNILNLDEDATINAKVGDFGLSRQAAPQLGELLPTWQWLSPEVIDPKGVHYDERADIYSFGIVCWELATHMNMTPFGEYMNEKDKTVIHRIIHEDLRPTIPASCPPAFANLIRDCWHANPNTRPSFDTIAERLTSMLEGMSTASVTSMDDSL